MGWWTHWERGWEQDDGCTGRGDGNGMVGVLGEGMGMGWWVCWETGWERGAGKWDGNGMVGALGNRMAGVLGNGM